MHGTIYSPSCSDADDCYPFLPEASWFLRQDGHVVGVAGEQNYRPWLCQCHHCDQCVEGTAVPGQAGPAEQLSGGPSALGIDGDYLDPAQYVMEWRVSGAAAQYLGERGCCRDHRSVACVRLLGAGKGSGIADR
jgi:hypothetical protein